MYETIGATAFDEDITDTIGVFANPLTTTRIVLIGGYTPRRCGIATFTADIYESLVAASPDIAVDVYAMTPALGHIDFNDVVTAAIVEGDPASFLAAALQINRSGADAVWLQHEFGLFGGTSGDMILELVDRIAAPLIVTMHTVIPDPDRAQMEVMQRLVARASKLVVMSEHGRLLLQTVYGADADQIALIPHGVPDRPFGRVAQFKSKFGFSNRQVLMTFGLLSPGKGIEAVLSALPAIIADHPTVLYCIVGATHPNLLAFEGEAYREQLRAQAKSLGIENHIQWVDTFVETTELLDLLEAADIYVTPYLGAAQSTSGTLSYAVALGKAVVSTPYVHAVELLADNHGILVPFNDSVRIAGEINALLDHPEELAALQRRAYDRGRSMIWPLFAEQCLSAIEEVKVSLSPMPEVDVIGISGLLRICDDNGILQHSVYSVPDRAHGYCVDDNARALMLMNRLGSEAEPYRVRMTAIFAAFVESAWNAATGEFRNFMDYQRNWLEDVGSEDSCGRTLWALGATALEGQTLGTRRWAHELFDRTAYSARDFRSPRATAFSMLGAYYRLNAGSPNSEAQAILTEGAKRLQALFEKVQSPDWQWFENVLAYDNCRIPEAMVRAGTLLNRSDFSESGIRAMRWIFERQTSQSGYFRPIGSDTFGRERSEPMPFDQQPVEIWAAIDGASAAFDATGDAIWIVEAQRAYDWFAGTNDRGVAVACPITGTCHDGINPRGLNLNQGAESVLAYQLARCGMRTLATKIAP
jgi:glycosyltransferase involved in cell wall biosynthesis